MIQHKLNLPARGENSIRLCLLGATFVMTASLALSHGGAFLRAKAVNLASIAVSRFILSSDIPGPGSSSAASIQYRISAGDRHCLGAATELWLRVVQGETAQAMRLAEECHLADTARGRVTLEAQGAWLLRQNDYVGAAGLGRLRGSGWLTEAARIEREKGQWEGARLLARAAIATDPGNVGARRTLAETLHLGYADPQGAIELYEQILGLQPDSLPDLLALGSLYDQAGRSGEALVVYRRAVRLAPENVEAVRGLARSLTRLGRPAEGAAQLEVLLARYPDDERLLMELANSYWYMGRRREAIRLVGRVVELFPDQWWPRVYLGRLYDGVGQHAAALEQLQEGIRLNPHDAGALMSLGETYVALEQKDLAMEAFRQALREDGDHDQQAAIEQRLQQLGHGE